jgi:DNA-directed RNA polymerase subunit M/transcription elongation factor TFIIS
MSSVSAKSGSKEQNDIREKLAEALKFAANKNNMDIDPDYLDTIVRRLEREAYNITIRECEQEYTDRNWNNPKFVNRYSCTAYKILVNIDPRSSIGSDKLAMKILMKEIEPKYVCCMSSYDMNPDASKDERDIIELRLKQKVDVKYSDKYTCKRCDAKKITFRETQSRSADEISTIKFECIECHHTWTG